MMFPGVRIHETAVVEPNAQVGSGSAIWHHCHVRSGAYVGKDCVLGKNVYIDAGAIVGDRCKVQNNVSVYVGVELANDVFVGPAATFTNDRVPRAFNADWQVTSTHVEQGVSIGANATIVCGVRLGEYSMVAAGATVIRDVLANQLVAGIPARHLGWVCRCGEVVSRDTDRPKSSQCERCAGSPELALAQQKPPKSK